METKTSKNKAFLIAAAVHAVILLICFLIQIFPPQPPFPEVISMEVAMADLGSTMDGSGDTPADQIALPSAEVKQTSDIAAQPLPQPENPPKELLTNDESTTTVASSTKPVKNPKEVDNDKTEATPVVPERQVNRRGLYGGTSGTPGGGAEGGSNGSGEGIGQRGVPGGQGGPGIGLGGGYIVLNGRSLVKGVSIPTTKEEGTVVLRIWVDRRGNVFKAEPILYLCTTTSEYLFGLATKAALQHQFNAKPDAGPEEMGKMTFKFVLN